MMRHSSGTIRGAPFCQYAFTVDTAQVSHAIADTVALSAPAVVVAKT